MNVCNFYVITSNVSLFLHTKIKAEKFKSKQNGIFGKRIVPNQNNHAEVIHFETNICVSVNLLCWNLTRSRRSTFALLNISYLWLSLSIRIRSSIYNIRLTILIFVAMNTMYTQQKPSCVMQRKELTRTFIIGARGRTLGGPYSKTSDTVSANPGNLSRFVLKYISSEQLS